MPNLSRKVLVFLSFALIIGSGFAAYTKFDAARKSAPPPTQQLLTRARLDLLQHTDREIVLEWECPEIQIERDPQTGRITGIDVPGAMPHFHTGVPRLPELSQLLDCLPGRVNAQIVDAETETRQLGDMAPMPEDFMIDPPGADTEGYSGRALDNENPPLSFEERRALTPLAQGIWPPENLRVNEVGVFRGHRLVNLQFFPVQVDARQGTARIVRRARIRITLPPTDPAAARIPDRSGETTLIRRMLGPLSATAQTTRMTEAFEGRGEHDSNLDETIGGRWKIIVNTPGIVRLTAEDLRFAGCPVELITTYDTHIHNRGRELPIHFVGGADGRFDDYDYIDFYAVPNLQTYTSITPSLYQDFWTTENVYWLSWGDGRLGLRLSEEDGSWRTGSLWGPSRVHSQNYVRITGHFERDLKLDRLGQSTGRWNTSLQIYGPQSVVEDHWFWGEYIGALSSRQFPASIFYPYTRSQRFVDVRAALQGLSYPNPEVGTNGHHRAVVSLNGITDPGLVVGKVTANDNNIPWIGQTPIIVQTVPEDSVGIRNSDLLPSGNVVSVSVTGDGLDGIFDKAYANWFEVDYDRDLRARGNFLMFPFDTTRGDTFSYDIRGFVNGNIEVWKLGHSRLTSLNIRGVSLADEGSSYAVRFQLISDDGYTVLAFDDRYPVPPLAIVPEYGTRDLRNLTGSEYLIIYHDSFAGDESLRRLDSLRRVTFNGSVDTFRVSEIYDQFSYGIANPEAIQRFLKYAYEHWTVRPTYACLIGDGIVDTRDPYHQQGNLIPSLYMPTFLYGITASDVLFGCVSGPPSDILPDIAIGRISCRSPDELAVYVEKLVRYEDPNATDYSSPFHSRFLFVSDNRGQFDFDRDYSEPGISLLPDYCNVSRVYLDSVTAGQGPSILRNAFRDGAIVVNYNGHGGGGQWSSTTLMNVSGVSLLNNAHAYPFITNFTCFVGAFDERNQSAVLGEAFLFTRNSRLDPVGGIGVYSTTSVGWAGAGKDMQMRLFNFMAELPAMTLGEIVMTNKTLYWGGRDLPIINNDPQFSTMMSMTLLGDPAVRLALPQTLWTEVRLDTNVVHSADTLYVSGDLPWDPQGGLTNVYLLPYNGDFRTTEVVYGVSHTTTRTKTPAFNTSLVIPEAVRTRHFNSLMVLIGPVNNRRFIAPTGHVIIYATDPGGPGIPPRDAIAAIPIFHADSLADLRLISLTTLPYSYIPNDTLFRFEVALTHRDGIEAVRARGVFRPAQGPVVLDTVRLTQTPLGRWQTPDLGPHPVFGGTYRIQFFARPFGGSEIVTAESLQTVEGRPDYGIQQTTVSPQFRPSAFPEFSVPIVNKTSEGMQHSPELRIRLTGVHDSTYYDSTLGRTVTVPADSFATFASVLNPWQQPPLFETRILAPFRPGSYRVTILLDPDSVITESNESNNRYQTVLSAPHIFPASNALGTYLPRSSPQTNVPHVFWRPGIADTIQVRVWPGSLPASPTCLIYRADSVTTAQLARLAPLGLFPVVSGQSTRAFRVTLADTTELLADGGSAHVTKTFTGLLDSNMVSNVALFLKRDGYDEWWMLRNRTIETVRRDTTYPPGGGIQIHWGGRVSGDAPCLGTIAVFRYSDNRGPDVALSAEGLRFTRYSILPRQPEIYTILADLSGIDRSPGRFYFVLDGDTIPDSDIAWSDSSAWGGNISAIVRPELDPGTHTIWVKATDNVGNTDSLTAEFEVRGKFGIEWAINYPNPFQSGTTIAYAVTDMTDDFVEVKIYTVSGRHIRTLHEPTRGVANYREISWNGRDMHNDVVANGVYFARIKAKQGKQEVEKIIKLAKVR